MKRFWIRFDPTGIGHDFIRLLEYGYRQISVNAGYRMLNHAPKTRDGSVRLHTGYSVISVESLEHTGVAFLAWDQARSVLILMVLVGWICI